MHSDILTYEVDGLTMRSHLYVDDGTTAPRPGVLVFPEAFGLGDHAKERAQRLAGLGYAALACDLHGEEALYEDLGTALELIGPLKEKPGRNRERAAGGLDALAERPEVDASRIAAIGFCFGGTMALELARGGHNIVGVVGFHSGLATAAPEDAHAIRGRILVCLGADDPGIDADQRRAFQEEMTAAGVDWQMHVYGGVVHGFTNPAVDRVGRPEKVRYDARADARSWAAMRTFFDEIFDLG